MLEVIAGDVFAVLGKFDGEAVVGALVHAREEALDNEPGLEFQAADLGEGDGVEVFVRIVSIGAVRHGMTLWRVATER